MVLVVDSLQVLLPGPAGQTRVVHDFTFSVGAGEVVAMVGESGSGKTLAALAVLGLLPPGGRTAGSIRFKDQDIAAAPEAERRRLRGGAVAMVFQDPNTALNPVRRVGDQLAEVIERHQRCSIDDAWRRGIGALEDAGIAAATARMDAYPHQLSGGLRQRVCIAMALANRPELVLADEPTTALDTTTQAQILTLLRSRCREEGAGLLLITHDLAVAAELAERVVVVRHGRVVEAGPVAAVLDSPRDAYTAALLAAAPRLPHAVGAA